jgi:hypothetical protein
MLAQRAASHKTASSSGTTSSSSSSWPSSSLSSGTNARSRLSWPRQRPAPAHIPRARARATAPRPPRAEPLDAAAAAAAAEQFMEDLAAADVESPPRPNAVRRQQNSRPDLNDPDWIGKVDDWEEFWDSTAWNQEELDDLMEMDDQHDADLAAMTLAAGSADAGATAVGLQRARALVQGLRDMRKRNDAVHILKSISTSRENWASVKDFEPDEVGALVCVLLSCCVFRRQRQ